MKSAISVTHPHLEPMTLDDLDAVLAIEQRAYSEPWTRGNLQDSLTGDYTCLACRQEGRLVGYAILMQVLNESHLLNFTIDPDWQGKGWGRELLQAVMAHARALGGTIMYLEVRHSNARALRLYRAAGFRQIGIRKQYYPSRQGREDAIVMGTPL